METTDELEEPDWQSTSEAVRDAHRSVSVPPQHRCIPSSVSVDGMSLHSNFRLAPEVGTASDLAQPGGFRRAHVLADETASEKQITYAQAPLEVRLEVIGAPPSFFITDVLQTRPDGTVYRFESRQYRRGGKPSIIASPYGEVPTKQKRFKLWIWRPDLIPWWCTFSYLIGGFLFTAGSFSWMIPGVGDMGHGAPEWEANLTVFIPFAVGAFWFTTGAYLAFVATINANLQEELQHLDPKGSVHRAGRAMARRGGGGCLPCRGAHIDLLDMTVTSACRLKCCVPDAYRWWAYQPHSLLYWSSLILVIGTLFFGVACACGFPHALDWAKTSHEAHWTAELWLVIMCSIIGSVMFVFNSFVSLAEVTHSFNVLRPPDRLTIGYAVGLLNFVGSSLFLVASLGYLVQDADHEELAQWEYAVSEWGVRFTYGVGSACFFIGALVSFQEISPDDMDDDDA